MALKLKYVLQPLFLVAAFFAVVQLGSAVNAMTVFNETRGLILVEFDCGFLCGNTWYTTPGQAYSYPSESGTIKTEVDYRGSGNFLSINVEAYGWVKLTLPSSGKVDMCAYDQKGSLQTCVSIDESRLP